MNKFKSIKEFPNYEININGIVRNRKTGKVKQQYINDSGYCMVTLHKDNNNGKPRRVHRLIAKHFIPNPDNKPHINHKDGNPLNNHVSNLEWCTHKENMQHGFRTGLINNSGEKNGQSKLTQKQVLEIKERLADGESQYSISKDYPVSRSCILGIKTGRLWNHLQEPEQTELF